VLEGQYYMGRSIRRLDTFLIGIVATISLAVPGPSAHAATTVYIDDCGYADLGRPPVCEPSIYIQADLGRNSIALRWSRSGARFTVSDSQAKVIAPDCRRLSPHSANCPYESVGPGDNFAISGRDGNDRISVGEFPRTPLGPELIGGPGHDVVLGGPFADFMYGGMGADVLWGSGGHDFITGGGGNFVKHERPSPDVLHGGSGDDRLGDAYDKGADSSYGGAGKDRIYAAEGSPDAVITAGAGKDQCRVDKRGDPTAHSCEKLIR
jgi:Ca2+-binding RTX toxin-like protein